MNPFNRPFVLGFILSVCGHLSIISWLMYLPKSSSSEIPELISPENSPETIPGAFPTYYPGNGKI